jgi:Xaa-Pro aminopeptidase
VGGRRAPAACDITALGFADAAGEMDRAVELGERWIEGTFFRRARAMGNDIGYDSIVGGGSHATTLHWIENTGRIVPGELVLLTWRGGAQPLHRPTSRALCRSRGTFTALQRELYDLVYAAQDAGIRR